MKKAAKLKCDLTIKLTDNIACQDHATVNLLLLHLPSSLFYELTGRFLPNANPSSMKILVSSVVEPRVAGSESLDSGSRWIRSFF